MHLTPGRRDRQRHRGTHRLRLRSHSPHQASSVGPVTGALTSWIEQHSGTCVDSCVPSISIRWLSYMSWPETRTWLLWSRSSGPRDTRLLWRRIAPSHMRFWRLFDALDAMLQQHQPGMASWCVRGLRRPCVGSVINRRLSPTSPRWSVSREFTPILSELRRFIASHAITDRRDADFRPQPSPHVLRLVRKTARDHRGPAHNRRPALSVSSVIHDRPSTPRSSFWTVRAQASSVNAYAAITPSSGMRAFRLEHG